MDVWDQSRAMLALTFRKHENLELPLLAVHEALWEPHTKHTCFNRSFKGRAATAHLLGRNIYAASFHETQSLFPLFLESADSVSHHNERLCWDFHRLERAYECVCVCLHDCFDTQLWALSCTLKDLVLAWLLVCCYYFGFRYNCGCTFVDYTCKQV